MTLDWTLFVLRVASGLCLLGLLMAFFVVLWRDYRSAAWQSQLNRRSYGHLIALVQVDDALVPTGEQHPLLPITNLGRNPTNNIVIQDTFASGEHAQVTLRDGQWWLQDRDSRNGTLLNQAPITAPMIVTDGDIIGIGNTSFQLVLTY